MAIIISKKKWNRGQMFAQFKPVMKNLFLISSGSLIFIYSMNAIMIPAKLFSGGLSGIAILIKYQMPWTNIGLVYLLLNIPLLVLGWRAISWRFILYTVFGIIFFSATAPIIQPPQIKLTDPLLAALLAGVICGVGSGLILRSIGSAGGIDILAVYLNKKYGLRIGTIASVVNAGIILSGIYIHDLNLSLYSIILLFTCGSVMNLVISGFSARMAVLVVSDKSDAIAQAILHRIGRGVTFLNGQGAFSRNPKQVILTVTTITELPKLKEIIIAQDPKAFVVVNNTFEVLGQRHGAMRMY